MAWVWAREHPTNIGLLPLPTPMPVLVLKVVFGMLLLRILGDAPVTNTPVNSP